MVQLMYVFTKNIDKPSGDVGLYPAEQTSD